MDSERDHAELILETERILKETQPVTSTVPPSEVFFVLHLTSNKITRA